MSRIDEALARSRNRQPEAAAPAIPPADGDASFASEPTLESGPEEDASAADLPPELPPQEPRGTAGAVDVDEDLRHTPLSDKLSISGGDPTSTEQYRRLAGRLYIAQAEHGTRVVMVTSAMPGEGKTLTSTNAKCSSSTRISAGRGSTRCSRCRT